MSLSDSRNFNISALAAVAIVALTPVAVYFCTRGLSQQGRTTNFESTSGEVAASGISASYKYVVEGREYTGTRMSFLRGDEQMRPGDGIAPGASVRVYYDPMNPEIAVLTPGTPLSAFGTAGLVGTGMMMCAAGLWWLSRRTNSGAASTLRGQSESSATLPSYREAA